MPTTVQVDGLRELERSLSEIEKHTSRRTPARNALKKAGQQTADYASRLAPDDPETDSKDLKSEIKVGTRLTKRQRRETRKLTGKKDDAVVEAYVGVTEEVNAYGHLQEFGTVNHAAQPFMRPAWGATRMSVLKDIVKFLKTEIGKAAKRQAKRKLAGK